MWKRKRRGHWIKFSMVSKNSRRHKRKYMEEYIKYNVQIMTNGLSLWNLKTPKLHKKKCLYGRRFFPPWKIEVWYTLRTSSGSVYKGTIYPFFNSSKIDTFVLQAVYQIHSIFLYNIISINFNAKCLLNIVHDTESLFISVVKLS